MAKPAVSQASPGYELWHPNRERAESKTTKAIITFLLLVIGGLVLVVTIGGWSKLQGGGGTGLLLLATVGLLLAFAIKISGWTRGALPMAAGAGILLLIFSALAIPTWFDRAQSGFSSPLLPEELLGLVNVVLVPIVALMIIATLIGFSQNWQVEEQRPLPGHPDFDREEAEEMPGGPPQLDSPGTAPQAERTLSDAPGMGVGRSPRDR